MSIPRPQAQTRSSLIYNPESFTCDRRRTPPVALPGAVKLACLRISTQCYPVKLHFDQRDASWMLLQRHTEARRITITFSVRSGVCRVPSKAASCCVGQSTNADGWTG